VKRVRQPSEAEAALLIVARDPTSALRRLRSIRALGPYRLVPHPLVVIEDRYWDTPEHTLAKRRVALRLRQYNGQPWATLKGPPRGRMGKKVIRRLEIEVPWRPEAVRRTLTPALARVGVPDVSPLEHGPWPPFEGAMARMGLGLIQSRTTRRWARSVFLVKQKSPEPFAEMAIDVVRYQIRSLSPKFPEVEVEAKGNVRGSRVEEFLSFLIEESKVKMEPWSYPKLAVGEALEVIASRGNLEANLAPGGWLKVDAYDEIRQILSRQPPGIRAPA
jgi:hypothetical protein